MVAMANRGLPWAADHVGLGQPAMALKHTAVKDDA